MLKSVLFSLFSFFTVFIFATLEESQDSKATLSKGFKLTIDDWYFLFLKTFDRVVEMPNREIPDELNIEALELFKEILPSQERKEHFSKFEDSDIENINKKINRFERLTTNDIITIFLKSIQVDICFFNSFFQPTLHIVHTAGMTKEEFIEAQEVEGIETLAEMKSHVLSLMHLLYSSMDRSNYPENLLNAYEAVYGNPLEFTLPTSTEKTILPAKMKWPNWFKIAFYTLISVFCLEVALGVLFFRKRRINSVSIRAKTNTPNY